MYRFANEHWGWEQVGTAEVAVTCKENGAVVYTFDSEDDGETAYDEEQIYANANLIAHAPDMYRLLKDMLATRKCSLKTVQALIDEIEAEDTI